MRLAEAHRDWLHQLASVYELVWATGWGEEANRLLSPFFGLPTCPVVPLPRRFKPSDKVPAIDRIAGDRSAAWVDDMLSMVVHEWPTARKAPTLLVDVDSATGLTRPHVDRLLAWVAGLQ